MKSIFKQSNTSLKQSILRLIFLYFGAIVFLLVNTLIALPIAYAILSLLGLADIVNNITTIYTVIIIAVLPAITMMVFSIMALDEDDDYMTI